MICCAVFNCNNNGKKKRKFIRFHKFPKRPNLLKQWIKFCCRKDIFNTKYARICSRHFIEDDFNNNLKFRMGFCENRTIKPDAVPSISWGNNVNDNDLLNDSKRTKRVEARTRKKIVEALLNESNQIEDISATSTVGKEEQVTSALLEDINPEIDHLQNNFEDVNITLQESSYFADENIDNINPKRCLIQNSNSRKKSDMVTETKCKIIERIKGSQSYIEQNPKPSVNNTILEKTDILLRGLDPMNRKEAEIKIIEYLWKCTMAQSKSQRIQNFEI